MVKRFKDALVGSFIGAIALGWIFAQAILRFAYVFSTPIATWVTRRNYAGELLQHGTAARGFSLLDALPELVRSAALLVVGYFLLRWLYFQPQEERGEEAESR